MDIEKISACNLFSGLSSDEIENILSETHFKMQHFSKGEILVMQDEPCNRLIILESGTVKAEMTDASGKVVKVEDISAPNPLAIIFLFGNNSRFPVQVTAKDNVSVLVIPKPSVLKMLHTNEQLLLNYLNICAHFAATLSKKLHLMSFRTIRQKLAMYILELGKPDRNEIEFDRTQIALAEYFGVSRPSLARELNNMQTDGLIEVNKKKTKILNRSELVQLITFR